MRNKLYRSEKGKVITGVCNGLAEHFNIDPIFIRLIFVLLSLINGLGMLIYAVLWLVLPRGIRVEAPETESLNVNEEAPADDNKIGEDLEVKTAEEGGEVIFVDKRSPFFVYLVFGLLSILIGIVFLMERVFPFPENIWLIVRLLWPVILVIAGFVIIIAAALRKPDVF